MAVSASADAIRDANIRYHDRAAASYDGKWGIDFGALGRGQVMGKVRKAWGGEPPVFRRALEIGAGTGYFSLNLLAAGVVEEATCTDISPGMLAQLQANAARLGLAVQTVPADAERLPLDDERFDLVLGHAVLHHLPDLDRAFAEFMRVLRPGGTLLFAGEPSRTGDRIAAYPKRAALHAAPAWRRLVRATAATSHDGHGDADLGLEDSVDVHAFVPADLARHARGAGFADVQVAGEELLANWFGWINRSLEATAEPTSVPMAWRRYAYHGYLLLQSVDRRLLEQRLPPTIFYNLLLRATRPGPHQTV